MGDVVDAEEISAPWLSDVLGTEVRGAGIEQVGAGQTGATFRLRLDAPDLPDTMIAKVATGDDAARAQVAVAYRNEVGFYRHLRPTLDVRAPRCWHAAISDDGHDFTLLLEDLAPRMPGIQVDGCSIDRAEGVARNLAALHAPRWNDPTLRDLEFIEDPTPEAVEFIGALAAAATEIFLGRYADDLTDEEAATLRAAAAAVAPWLVARPDHFSVVHGDYRLDNLMFGEDPEDVYAVDWQTITIGPPARDLAYFLGTCLEPEERRANEDHLVRTYHQAITQRGVAGYGPDRCFEDYRLGQLQGPLITTLGAAYSPSERSESADRMFLAMTRRTCAAIRDLTSLDLL
ncbi:phosphotransferase [Aquihabitans daechungensis]|uniref:phosphotransferase n=1 Tax=Aquihabitans daechungensis TaxID=1052257 RepID=UPI003B9FE960